MVPCAYLRVYQPLSAFSVDERAHWERYIADGRHLNQGRMVYKQRVQVDGLGLLAPTEVDEADVRVVEGSFYVCPWRMRIRVLASLLSLRENAVPEMADALVPEPEARRAAKELSRLRRRDPTAVPFILQSTWHVPIRWFLLVRDTERKVLELDDGGYKIVYETTVSKARRRVDWALAIVRKTDLEPLIDLLADLSDWLGSFEQSSIVELDYASVSNLMTWDEMDDDRSARDLEDAVDSLGAGEIAKSGDLYQAVAGRWAEVRAHENLN